MELGIYISLVIPLVGSFLVVSPLHLIAINCQYPLVELKGRLLPTWKDGHAGRDFGKLLYVNLEVDFPCFVIFTLFNWEL